MSNQFPNQYHKLLECIKEDPAQNLLDLAYSVDDRGVVIEGYFGDSIEFTIPSTIEDRPVYKIDEEAFCGDGQLTKITLPDTIRVIGERAFAESSVETVVLSNTLLIIGKQAFANSCLKTVDIPPSVAIIGEEAFEGTEIDLVEIPEAIVSIGTGAFAYTNVTSVRIPSNVKVIPKEIFRCCDQLHTVIIEGAEIIEKSAFFNCFKLENIYLPDTLTEIHNCALGSTGLKFIIIPQSVLSIGENNFPPKSHVAILSDKTEFALGKQYDSCFSAMIYCNPTNTKTRKIAKEYGLERRSLSSFAKESADFYNTGCDDAATTISSSTEQNKLFDEQDYCQTKCEFFNACQGNKKTCVKGLFDKILSSLSPCEEKTIRLLFGVGDVKETSAQLVVQTAGISSQEMIDEWTDYISSGCFDEQEDAYELSDAIYIKFKKNKALRKLRHPARSRLLRTSDIGIILLSTNETCYFELWCAIFGEKPTASCREKILQEFREIKEKEEQEKRDEEEFAKRKKEQQSRITIETMIKDCCFGAYGDEIRGGDAKIQDLIRLTGEQAVNEYGYNHAVFEEIVTVLASKNLYFLDCDMVFRTELKSYVQKIFPESLCLTLEELDLSVRAFNSLKRVGIHTVEDLIRMTIEDVCQVSNLGKKGTDEVILKLKQLGLSFKDNEG